MKTFSDHIDIKYVEILRIHRYVNFEFFDDYEREIKARQGQSLYKLRFLKNNIEYIGTHLNGPIQNSLISIYDYHTQELVKTITTDTNGQFKTWLPRNSIFVFVAQNAQKSQTPITLSKHTQK